MLWNHATVRGPSHSRQHGGEAGVPAEYFEHHEALVGPGAVRRLLVMAMVRVTQVLKPMQ